MKGPTAARVRGRMLTYRWTRTLSFKRGRKDTSYSFCCGVLMFVYLQTAVEGDWGQSMIA